MAAAAPAIVSALFWALTLAVIVAPRRWSLLAYLVVIQIDVSGPGWASPTAVGMENAIKIGLLPVILLARARGAPLSGRWGRPLQLWLLFTGYVALASLWSPYPLSAFKMVAYLVGYALVFLVFAHAWRVGVLDLRQVIAALWLSLGLAALQTYALGNPFGAPPKTIIEQARFTSFAPPQSFAAYLVAVGALLMAGQGSMRTRRERAVLMATGGATAFALLLVGSRYAFIGALGLLGVTWMVRLMARFRGGVGAVSVKPLLVATAMILSLVGVVAVVAPQNRIFALRKLVAGEQINPQAIGTLEWRLVAYQTALDDIRRRDPLELLVGSGTSSGARVVLEFDAVAFPAGTLDPNRAMHNEFLRALYEWGIVGATLFLSFLGALIAGFARLTRTGGWERVWAFWAFLPALTLGLAVENVLAGAGTPVGTGFMLVIAFAAARGLRPAYHQGVEHADPLRPQLLPAARR